MLWTARFLLEPSSDLCPIRAMHPWKFKLGAAPFLNCFFVHTMRRLQVLVQLVGSETACNIPQHNLETIISLAVDLYLQNFLPNMTTPEMDVIRSLGSSGQRWAMPQAVEMHKAASLMGLPTELLLEIADCVEDTETLRSLSRTCQRFYGVIAQETLYRHVVVDERGAFHLLKALVKDQCFNPRIQTLKLTSSPKSRRFRLTSSEARLVKRLREKLDSTSYPWVSEVFPSRGLRYKDFALFVQVLLLRSMPGICSLEVDCHRLALVASGFPFNPTRGAEGEAVVQDPVVQLPGVTQLVLPPECIFQPEAFAAFPSVTRLQFNPSEDFFTTYRYEKFFEVMWPAHISLSNINHLGFHNVPLDGNQLRDVLKQTPNLERLHLTPHYASYMHEMVRWMGDISDNVGRTLKELCWDIIPSHPRHAIDSLPALWDDAHIHFPEVNTLVVSYSLVMQSADILTLLVGACPQLRSLRVTGIKSKCTMSPRCEGTCTMLRRGFDNLATWTALGQHLHLRDICLECCNTEVAYRRLALFRWPGRRWFRAIREVIEDITEGSVGDRFRDAGVRIWGDIPTREEQYAQKRRLKSLLLKEHHPGLWRPED